MKVTRNMLLIITASLGVLIIVYSLVRQFFGIGLSGDMERYVFDGVIIAALGCFMYNRKLAKDEKLAKEAALALQAAEEAEHLADEEPKEELSPEEENLPHWERTSNKGKNDNEE
ncbi:MAG: hypothetical protein FWG07_11355 [Treponema sp.]|nr:hypothetical protein [Treponema sp.]